MRCYDNALRLAHLIQSSVTRRSVFDAWDMFRSTAVMYGQGIGLILTIYVNVGIESASVSMLVLESLGTFLWAPSATWQADCSTISRFPENLSSTAWNWEPEFVVSAWSKLSILWGRFLAVTEHIMSMKVDCRQRADCMTSSFAVCNCNGFSPQCVSYWRIPLLGPSHDCGRYHGNTRLAAVTVVDVNVFKAYNDMTSMVWSLDTLHRLAVKCMSKTRRFRQILCNIFWVLL